MTPMYQIIGEDAFDPKPSTLATTKFEFDADTLTLL